MLHLLCLFDKSGIFGKDWADAGHMVTCVDWEADEGFRGGILYRRIDLRDRAALYTFLSERGRPDIVVSFPDCTNLAVSGAGHFANKREREPDFQEKAMHLFRTGEAVSDKYDIPSLTENPVSVAATMERPPEHYWHPYEFGGYLPENDVHPIWPEYIAPRDAYPKKTGAWLKNGCLMPPKRVVEVRPGYSDQHLKLGGKSKKTKDIRSMTPRGFSRAFFETMEPILNANPS